MSYRDRSQEQPSFSGSLGADPGKRGAYKGTRGAVWARVQSQNKPPGLAKYQEEALNQMPRRVTLSVGGRHCEEARRLLGARGPRT